MKQYVVGHKIPDSDSICSSISLAYLLNKIGHDATPARLGEPNPETKFILEKFNQELPILKESYANENVFIVDHSDINQAPDDIDKATIVGIIDHHKLGDLTTSTPLECWIRPIGCSSTVVKEVYDHYKIEIPKDIAGMMLCTILSDTVILKSPTTTQTDINAVNELSKISGIQDYKALALEMFKAKSNIKGVRVKDLVLRDFKEFTMNGKEIGVGQLETVDLSIFDELKDKLKSAMQELKNEKKLHTIMLFLTDIIEEGSLAIVYSNEIGKLEKEFKIKFENSETYMKGILSRKKQIIPYVTKAFS